MLFAEEDEQVPPEEAPPPDPEPPDSLEGEADGVSGFLEVSRSDFTQPARPL